MSTTAFPKVHSVVEISLENNRLNQANRFLRQATSRPVLCTCVQNTLKKIPADSDDGKPN